MNFTQRCSLKTIISRSLLMFLLVSAFSACIPNRKYVLLQEHEKLRQDTSNIFSEYAYRLQCGDVINLDIRLLEPDERLKSLFIGATLQGGGNLANGSNDFFYLTGFSLDDSGNITLPLVGKVYLKGKTKGESQQLLEQILRTYINSVYVTVRLGGFRFSILGEVNRPGKYSVFQSRVTMLEALAVAGDFTQVAKRDRVVLLRQYADGSRIHELNFLDVTLINSPYFYLQPNDILYVEPLKIRAIGTGYQGIQTFTTLISVLSSTLVVITLLRK